MDSRIYLSHKTAFELLRFFANETLEPVRFRQQALCSNPSGTDVLRAVDILCQIYPSLQVSTPVHFLTADKNAAKTNGLAKGHLCTMPLSGQPFLKLLDGVYVSSPEFAYTQCCAGCKSMPKRAELGFEACGEYQTTRTSTFSDYQIPALTTVASVKRFVTANPSLNGAAQVKAALPYVRNGSQSARETKLALLLGLPVRWGGYGLGMPEMDHEVPATPEARQVYRCKSVRCDLYWPGVRMDVEYQSKDKHEGESHRIKDSRREHALEAMNWLMVNVTNSELDSYKAMEVIAEVIRKHLGKRVRVRCKDYHARKLKLRRQLGLPVGYDDWWEAGFYPE